MLTTANQPNGTQRSGAPRSAPRSALVCAATLASVTLLATGPAHARIEPPLDTEGRSVPSTDSGTSDVVASGTVAPTRVTGRYGVKVNGGWALR